MPTARKLTKTDRALLEAVDGGLTEVWAMDEKRRGGATR